MDMSNIKTKYNMETQAVKFEYMNLLGILILDGFFIYINQMLIKCGIFVLLRLLRLNLQSIPCLHCLSSMD
jgi:hypothetical protein